MRPQLTISLLISNRIETIPRCLDSLKPIMDAIPCELILIDTSKNKEIHNLLLKYTDQVYEFEWCNDFAKARNEGLRRASGEWFMFLDDDEWFVDVKALIEFFKSGEYHKYGYANYQVRNFHDAQYVYYDDCWLARIFRIEQDTQFVRKIHEQFSPMRGLRKDLGVLVYHSGYIYETPEDRRRHFERNRKLLLDMIKEEPDNIYWWLQLTQEYSYVGEQELLVEHCRKCLQKVASIDTPHVNNQRGSFYTGLVTGYLRLKKYDACIKGAEEALANKGTGIVLEAVMYLRLAEAYLCLEQIEKAADAVQKYLQIADEVDLNEAHIVEQLAVFLAGEAFSKNSQEVAYGILICVELKKGNTNALRENYERLGWSNPVVYTMEGIESHLVDAMWTLPYESFFVRIIMDAFAKYNLREAFRKEILSVEPQDTSVFQEQIYLLAEAMQSLIDGPKESVLDYRHVMQRYVQNVNMWYDFLDEQGMLVHLGEEIPGYIQAAVDISDYFELESKDKIAALNKLKNAVDFLPEIAVGMGEFFQRYPELERQLASQQRNEMDVLRAQILQQVYALCDSGMKLEALQILQQMKAMFPNDLEILEIEERINS